MENLRTQALKGFSVSMLALAMVACGGGSSDDPAPAANNNTNNNTASSLTAVELAKVASAIQSAKTIFDVVSYGGIDGIEEVITDGKAGKDINCGTSLSAGKFKVTANTATAYSKDGSAVNDLCLESGEKWDGSIAYECKDAACDNSVVTSTNAVWGDTVNNVDLKISGTMTTSTNGDVFKGTSSISKSGQSTLFTFSDVGLTQSYPAKNTVGGSGALSISNGSATNCIDGTYSYTVATNLTMPSGTQRLNGGSISIKSGSNDLGTVSFNTDGSIKVKLPSGVESTVSKLDFEGTCGLKEAYMFSEK
ncbi:MAG: hypothetical protein KDI39_10175 [Pseudomonadales bacterium]|nr:hypothetical protein [Pseudomonadales bacterium]HMY01481.1 hypothetical protein [Agitococcus sp.]HNC04174.1 hypothetical protein [Agitococcus sp.]